MGFGSLFACFRCQSQHDNDEVESIQPEWKHPSTPSYNIVATTSSQVQLHPENSSFVPQERAPQPAQPTTPAPAIFHQEEGLQFVFNPESGMTAGIQNSCRKYSADRPIKLIKIPYEERLEMLMAEEEKLLAKLRGTSSPPVTTSFEPAMA